jgi:ABC-2 type transport system permease protein
MTSLSHELQASYAFMERNFFLTRRTWAWEVAFLVYSVASALSISLIGVDQGSSALVLSLMVGAIFWNYLSVVFGWIAETIAVERWEGTLEYTMMAPIRRSSRLIGQVSYAIVYGLIHTVAIFVVLVLFFPAIDLSKANPGTAAAFMALGSFAFVGIGVIGVYYSVTILPQWMQVLSKFSPATYVLDGVRKGIVEGTPITELWYDVWPLIVLGLVYIPFGLWAFGRAEHYAKRTGKLKRVG